MKNNTGKFFFPRIWAEKALLFLLAFLTFLFFSNDFGLIDIQKTAIILAAGIDRTEEGEFSVTAEIAVPAASRTGENTTEISVNGKGDTVARAFREINVKTGWFPKLVFCDLIVLGENTAKRDVFDALGYFLRNEYMSDNCLVATCEGNAEDLFSAGLAVDEMPALALQKILSTEAKKAGNISAVNLKDFSVGYYAEHKSGYMPYIRRLPEDKKESENDSSVSGGGSGGSGEAGQSEKQNPPSLDASYTALFFEGRNVGLLDADESLAFNLAYNSIRLATLEVEAKNEIYALALKNVKHDVHFKAEGGALILFVSVSAAAQTADESASGRDGIREIAEYRKVNDEVLRATEKKITEKLLSAFETARENHCDLFEVVDKLRKYAPERHAACKDFALERVVPKFRVKIKNAF